MEDIILLGILPMLMTMEKIIEEGGITFILMEKAIIVNKDIINKHCLIFKL